jgi:ferredoxin
MRIHVDYSRCEGNGFCEQAAPDLFHLDDEGRLEVLVDEVPPGRELSAQSAVQVCPVSALRLDQDEPAAG